MNNLNGFGDFYHDTKVGAGSPKVQAISSLSPNSSQ
jgi:hypothetical protein